MESEVKLLHDNGQQRLKYKRVNFPNANTFLVACPLCNKPIRRRKTKQVPSYEAYLQIKPEDPTSKYILSFQVWIRDTFQRQAGHSRAAWQKGGIYKVRLDIWDDFINEGQGGYIRNPLLNELHWHREEPQ